MKALRSGAQHNAATLASNAAVENARQAALAANPALAGRQAFLDRIAAELTKTAELSKGAKVAVVGSSLAGNEGSAREATVTAQSKRAP